MNKILPFGLLLVVFLTGCKFFGADAAPPSRTEAYLFDVITNLVPRQVWKTNEVEVKVPVYVLHTNEFNQINQLTNTVIVKQFELERATNWVEAYTWTPKTNTVQYAQTAGTLANFAVPGSGGAVAGILIGLAGAWAKLRSSKKTNVALAQNVETALEFIKTVPGGDKYTAAIKQFMQKDQADQGVEKGVKAARAEVDNLKAKASVGSIDATIKTFSGVDRAKA